MSNVKNYSEQGGEHWVVEGELEIAAGGKLTFEGKELKTSSSARLKVDATTIAALKDDFNALLEKLKAAGLMESG